jgi:hypothetical protein
MLQLHEQSQTNVIKLRDHLGLSSEPVFVPVEVNAAAIHGDCFKNVSEKIATSGGQLQYGWTVWESPDQLIEGEFHAVWVSPEDRFVDVTPKPDGEKKIVFIPDQKRTYKGIPIDNVYIPLSDDPLLLENIRRNKEYTKLRKKYNKEGRAEIPLDEMELLFRPLAPEPQKKLGRNQRCPCGSGKKFKHCHGANR